jgi:hypothetical protein
MSAGRGCMQFNSQAEHMAFGAWFRDQVERHGGRKLVSERSGVSPDTISACSSGRRNPARASLVKLIDIGVIEYATPEDMSAQAPWLAPKYIKLVRLEKAARKQEQEAAVPAFNGEIAPAPATAPVGSDLMEAIMTEPSINAKQRAQLAALAAMIVNGVEIDISIAPRR